MTEIGAAWNRHGDLAAVSPAEARRIAEEVRAPWARGGPQMAATREHPVATGHGAVRVRCYDPAPGGRKPAFIYLHGGGWMLFSLDTHDRVMREYAARAGMVVVGIDYALAPEAKYPVALEQVTAVARFCAERGEELGIDPLRIAIGGDSAGANLAIAACIRLRDECRLSLRGMVLNYGVFERRSSAEARERFGGSGNMLTAQEMETFWGHYLPAGADPDDPLVCPLRADLEGVPPALLVVPEYDLLTEQSVHLAERLAAASVPVQLAMYRAVHSFLESVSISKIADRAFAETAAWLRAAVVCS